MSDVQSEEWRIVPSADFLEASSLGRVRRKWLSRLGVRTADGAYHVYTPAICRMGRAVTKYAQLCISHNGRVKSYRVHRLVCEAFNGSPPTQAHHAAHKDGDSLNNIPLNLYWATPVENAADKTKHGRTPTGAKHGRARLTSADVAAIREILSRGGATEVALAARFKISQAQISNIRTGRAWRDDLRAASAMTAAPVVGRDVGFAARLFDRNPPVTHREVA